jgi:hypothetical protein
MNRFGQTAALTAVAVIATGTVGGLASASSKVHTTLGIRELKQQIVVGGTDVVSGELQAKGHGPLAGASVALLKRNPATDGWKQVQSTTTNESGVARFTVKPGRTSRFELKYAGDATYAATKSGVVTTVVRQRFITRLGISVAKHSIASGDSDVITGRLHRRANRNFPHGRGLEGRTVSLESKAPGTSTWSVVSTLTTGNNGVVQATVTPAQTTRYSWFFAHTKRLAASRSRGVTIWVGQPTSLSVAESASSIDPGETDTISGVLTANGQPLADQTVLLLGRANNEKKRSQLGSGTTASDGTVSFAVSPALTTHYVLVFRRTASYAPAFAGPLTVIVRRATSLSIRAQSSNIASGASDLISGVLLAGKKQLGGRTVTLQSAPAGSGTWSDVDSAKTGKHGYVAFTVHPTQSTDYRLVFAPAPRFEGCQSGVVTVTVS